MLIISTITNGPYWKSSYEPMLYPTGISFYRQFSYRHQWLDEKIIQETSASTFKVKDWIRNNSSAFFCIRFLGKHADEIVPIRKVELTHVNPGDPLHVYFRLSKFVDYKQIDFPQLIDLAQTGIPNDKLFFRAPDDPFNLPLASDDESVWNSIVEKFSAADQEYPFNNRNPAFFIRLSKAYNRNSQLSPKKIGKSNIKGPIYGFELVAGDVGELKYLHRQSETAAKGELKYSVSSESPNVDLLNKDLFIQGSYREHAVTIHGNQVGPVPVMIDCEPVDTYEALECPTVRFYLRFAIQRWKAGLAVVYVCFLFFLAFFLAYELNTLPQSNSAYKVLSVFSVCIVFPIILDLIKKYIQV